MTSLDDLFTLSSLLSLQGAAAAALLLPNVLGMFVALQPKARLLLSLIVAMLLSLMVAYLAADPSWTKWMVAFFNGLLVFMAAVGINEATAARAASHAAVRATPPPGHRGFVGHWF